METDLLTKSRQVDGWLAVLNFGLAAIHLVQVPFCAFAYFFIWSMTDPLASWTFPSDLIAILCLGGVVLLGGTLCLGFLAGNYLLKGQPSGRILTRFLVLLAILHMLLAAFGICLHERGDLSRIFHGLRNTWFYMIPYFGPGIVYCIVVPALMRMRSHIRLVVDEKAMQQGLFCPSRNRNLPS